MRAHNRKRKPKHMTKHKHIFREDEIGCWNRIFQFTTKRKSETKFWYDRKGKSQRIYRVYKLRELFKIHY